MLTQNAALDFIRKEQTRFKAKIGVFLVLFEGDRVLCLRRAKTGIEDGFYVVPMGGLEEGETPLQAVTREGREEVNVTVNPQDLALVHTMYRKHTQPDGYIFYQQDLYFLTRTFSGTICNLEPHKADDLAFFEIRNLPLNISPCVKQALSCILENVTYSEFGFEEASERNS